MTSRYTPAGLIWAAVFFLGLGWSPGILAQDVPGSASKPGDAATRVVEEIRSEPGGYFPIKGGQVVLDFSQYRGPRYPEEQQVTIQFSEGPQILSYGVDPMDLVRYLLDDEKMFYGLDVIHAVGPGSLQGPGTMMRRHAHGQLYIEVPDRFGNGPDAKALEKSFVVDVRRELLLDEYPIPGSVGADGKEVTFRIHPGLRRKLEADHHDTFVEETVLYYREQGIDVVAVSRFLQDGVMSRETALARTADQKFVLMIGIDWWAHFRLLVKSMQASENVTDLQGDPLGFNMLEEDHRKNWFTHVFGILKMRGEAPRGEQEAAHLAAVRQKVWAWVEQARFPVVDVADPLEDFLWRINARERQVTLLIDTVPLPAELRPPKVELAGRSEVSPVETEPAAGVSPADLVRMGDAVTERALLRMLSRTLPEEALGQAKQFQNNPGKREAWLLPLMLVIGLPCVGFVAFLVRRSYA